MPESYRELPDAEYRNRIRRLGRQIDTLREQECTAEDLNLLERLEHQLRTLRVERLKQDTATLKDQLAASSPDTTEASLLEYLRTQTEPVEEDRIHEAVHARRATIQKTLRKFVDDGQVKRSGGGINSHGERWRTAQSGQRPQKTPSIIDLLNRHRAGGC